MDEFNEAADSGLTSGNAGGEPSAVASTQQAAPSQGLSLKDSLAKAATSIRERTTDTPPARGEAGGAQTAFETKPTQPGSPPGQNGSPEGQASPILEAPKHWPQKRRDAFGRFMAQNPDATAEWLAHTKELEGEFTRKSQEHADVRKFADGVRELFAPFKGQLQQTGMDEYGAVKHLVSLHDFAAKDPAGYAKWFMQQAGLTPQQLFPEIGAGPQTQAQPNGESEWIDPEIVKLREENGSLSSQMKALIGELNQVKGWVSNQQVEKQTQVQQTIGSAIEQFAGATDESGTPLHPHFGDVEDRMAWEFLNNPELKGKPVTQEALKMAYEFAVWANPTTRQAMLQAQQASQQAVIAKQQAADKARAAQTLKPKLGSSAGVAKVPSTDLKSIIRDAAKSARG